MKAASWKSLPTSSQPEPPEEYLQEARDREIEYLLENPLTLELLVKACASPEWPESKMETYERACSVLAKELNTDHLAVNPNRLSRAELLEAASELCAIQLLSGKDGYSQGPEEEGGTLFLYRSLTTTLATRRAKCCTRACSPEWMA